MNRSDHAKLKTLLRSHKWVAALGVVDRLLRANSHAAQLFLLRGQLIQLQPSKTKWSLKDAETAIHRSLELDETCLNALVELMHFYDCVCPNRPKTLRYARKVRLATLKALEEANEVIKG